MDGLLPKQPRFQANILSINLVAKEIYHGIEGLLITSSKFVQGGLFEELAEGFERIKNDEIF